MSLGQGLQYTKAIEILPAQGNLGSSLRNVQNKSEEEQLNALEMEGVYLPTSVASSNLNSLIRLLIARLPRQQLNSFQ